MRSDKLRTFTTHMAPRFTRPFIYKIYRSVVSLNSNRSVDNLDYNKEEVRSLIQEDYREKLKYMESQFLLLQENYGDRQI